MIKFYKFIAVREKLMKVIFLLSSVFSIFALLVICIFLLLRGFPTFAEIGLFKFLFGATWHPEGDNPVFGILPMILGTLYVTALSVILGVSLGLFTSVFLYKFCPKKLVAPIRQIINLLAGIPSVIYGLFGLSVVVPFIRNNISPNYVGYGILAASIILSIMILPTIVSISLEALNSVPKSYYEGALALGATKEQTVFKVMVPAAKSGIFAAVVLAIGRALGETMAVLMVIGSGTAIPTSLFQNVSTLTSNIAIGAQELGAKALDALIASGVVLFVFSLLLNVSFSLIKNKGDKRKR